MGIEALAMGSLGGSVLGGGLGAVGNIMGGMAASRAAEYRASVAERMANYAIEKGNVEAEAQGRKTGAILGAQRAAQGANGLAVNEGSNVDVRASTASLGRLDELTILNNAANKAMGLRTEAELERAKGESDKLGSWLKAGGSILGGATQVADKWMNYQARGTFN